MIQRRLTELLRLVAASLLLSLVVGCASTTPPLAPGATQTPGQRADPWENWNRKVFSFNDVLDDSVLKPVATAYTKVVPELVRRGISNFFGNFSDLWSAANNLLQGKVGDGMQDIMRVGTNLLFGFGVMDVASEAGLERHREDFGQTLGVWGFSSGPYVVWPLLGPSTLRDSVGLPLDLYASPALVVYNDGAQVGLSLLSIINTRASLLGATNVLDDIALDRYTFVRDAYLQRRRSLVHDGEAPEENDPEDDPAGGAAPVPIAPASAVGV